MEEAEAEGLVTLSPYDDELEMLKCALVLVVSHIIHHEILRTG